MKKFKKLISTLTAAVFLFTAAAPAAFASVDSSISRLNALGVVTGYTNGEFKADQNITRAEYAAVAVRLLGLEDAVEAAKGATTFSDVAASNWASGYINIAAAQGVIKGYPDGTFKPEAPVKNSEAFAMLVRVLGYEPTVKGTWPTNYIGKAASIGLLDGVGVSDYNQAATRGTVFVAADNALDINVLNETYSQEQTADGTKTIMYTQGATLMAERLKVTELKDQVITNVDVLNGLKNNQIELNGAAKTMKPVANYFNLYQLNTKAYLKDNKVIALKADEDEVFTDKISDVSQLGSNKITFYNAGTKNTALTAVYKDFAPVAASSLAGDYATVVMDGGKVSKLIVNSFAQYGIVDRVEDNIIYFNDDPSATDIDLDGVDMDYVQIFRNGAVAQLSDIQPGDFVSYANSGDKWMIVATDNKVEGKLDRVYSAANGTFKLIVDGKTIYSTDALQYSVDDGDSYASIANTNITNLNDDVVGQDVTVTLNPNGEAVLVSAGTQGTSNTAKVLVRDFASKVDVAGNTASTTKYIKVTKLDGTMVVYEIDNSDYVVNMTGNQGTLDLDKSTDSDLNGTNNDDADVNPGDFAKITFNADGDVTKVQALTADTKTMKSSNGIDKNNDLVYDSTEPFVVVDDTSVVQVDKYGDNNADHSFIDKTKKISWATVEDNETAIEGYNVKLLVDGKEIVMMFVDNNTAVTTSKVAGVAVGGRYGIGGGDYAIKLMVDGTTDERVLDSSVEGFAYSNAPVVFEMNSDNTKVKNIAVVNAQPEFTKVASVLVDSIDTVGDKLIISDGTTNYMVKKDAVKYFDNTGSTIESVNGISKGKTVDLYDILDKDGDVADGVTNVKDGIYDYVVIVD